LAVVATATGVASADWVLDTEVALLQAASINSADTAGSVRPTERLYCIVEVSRSFESVSLWLLAYLNGRHPDPLTTISSSSMRIVKQSPNRTNVAASGTIYVITVS
jgi:hypothetical protein